MSQDKDKKLESKPEEKVQDLESKEVKAQASSQKETPKEEAPQKEAQPTAKKEEAPQKEAQPATKKEEAPQKEAQPVAKKEEAPQKEAQPVAKKEEAPQKEAQPAAEKQEAPKEASAEEAKDQPQEKTKDSQSIELDGLFAFKMSMTTFYNKEGRQIPVTALRYKPWVVSQIKTKEKEGYTAIQVACSPQKNNRCSRALIQHLKPSGFKEGARYIKEIRQELPEGLKVGQQVSIDSLKQGDRVKFYSQSKGLGFTGVMKRWNFAGGKASHGSKSHRRVGSIGQHTEPARVMPGRKMPGRCGFQKVSKMSEVVEIYPKEGILFIKGPVPGARNTLVTLEKQGVVARG